MRPEDIDNLFKERLGNTSPTPPTDLWNRLHERMQAKGLAQQEEEETKVVPLLPKQEKPGFAWMYSSIAAAVSLVLSVGVVFYNINSGTPEVNEALADKSRILELHEKPVTVETAPATLAEAGAATENKAVEENILSPQATEATSPASNQTEEDVKAEAIARATHKRVATPKAEATAPRQPQATVQQAIATTSTSLPERTAEATPSATEPIVKSAAAVAKADANLNAEPVEIIIKRAVASQTAMAEAAEAPSGLDKKAKLAKNIFKQVRNLANGDEVELSEIGINADKVALNTQIGKQKFSKVINL